MSFENPNRQKNIPSIETRGSEFLDVTPPRDIDALTMRLKDYFYDQSDPSLQKNKENYLTNVNSNQKIRALIEKYPDRFDYFFYILGESVFSSEDMDILGHNLEARQVEILENEKDRHDRIITNPKATDEEYRLGAYAESMESQVREAVFKLQEKGYRPIGSGFDDPLEGSQMIMIDKKAGVDIEGIKKSLSPDNPGRRNFLDSKISKIAVLEIDDRINIVLSPIDKKMSVADWKPLWNGLVDILPDANDLTEDKKSTSNNGFQGMKFRQDQDRLKEDKNAWLGSGLAFVNGAIVSMSEKDFIKLTSK
jgi:hypothetical protein